MKKSTSGLWMNNRESWVWSKRTTVRGLSRVSTWLLPALLVSCGEDAFVDTDQLLGGVLGLDGVLGSTEQGAGDASGSTQPQCAPGSECELIQTVDDGSCELNGETIPNGQGVCAPDGRGSESCSDGLLSSSFCDFGECVLVGGVPECQSVDDGSCELNGETISNGQGVCAPDGQGRITCLGSSLVATHCAPGAQCVLDDTGPQCQAVALSVSQCLAEGGIVETLSDLSDPPCQGEPALGQIEGEPGDGERLCCPSSRSPRCSELGILCGAYEDEDGSPLNCGDCILPPGASLEEASAVLNVLPTAQTQLAANDGALQATLEAYVAAEADCRAGEFQRCNDTIRQLWDTHGRTSATIAGANLGRPPFYSPLRIMDDYSRIRLLHPERVPRKEYTFTVAIFAGARANVADPAAVGLVESNALSEELTRDDYAAVREAFSTFAMYVEYLTEGYYSLNLGIVVVDAEAQVNVAASGTWEIPRPVASINENLPDFIRAQTNHYLLVYPSLIADYPTTSNIVGGNGDDVTFCSDQWLLTKKPSLGSGGYSTFERQVYFARWLQHEYMHFLYRDYPDFGLEDTPHQWFDRSTWPEAFEGDHEIDYYHESINELLHPEASPPLHEGLLAR